MRLLEASLLLMTSLIMAGWIYGIRVPFAAKSACATISLIFALHLVTEGARIQMVPGYLATLLVIGICVWPESPRPKLWGSLIAIPLIASAVLTTIMPVFSLPEPTGSFAIGSTSRHFVDHSRKERNGDGPRELMVQIWYPSQGHGAPQYYCTNTPANLKKAHLRLVRLHSTSNVPIPQEPARYPVLIFGPAWTGNCNQLTYLAEELASHGFIVIGIDHPFGSETTTFPDGRIVRTVLGSWLDYSSDESLAATIRVAEAELSVRAADVRFVLDEIERLDKRDPDGLLTNRADLTRVGVFGYSFGGAVAAEVCRADDRFKAGVNFDGLTFGEARAQGLSKPYLLLEGDDDPQPSDSKLHDPDGAKGRYQNHLDGEVQSIKKTLAKSPGGYWLTIQHCKHSNFTDSPLYTPIRRFVGAGGIEPRRALSIVREYTRSFFQKHLLAQDDGLLNGSSLRFPDVDNRALPPSATSFSVAEQKDGP